MKKFWLPYSLWDIQGIELWLNELAAKGYELKKFSKFWSGRAEFQPSEEAKHCRYRLDPIGKDERELRERAANYRELGWRFVEQIGKLYAVYRCDDPEAPELYTDPESLGWAMKKLIRRQWLGAAAVLLWACWLLRDLLGLLITAPAVLPMRLILQNELALLYLLLAAVVVSYVLPVFRRTVQFARLRRRLVQGEVPPSHRLVCSQLREPLSLLAGAALIVVALILTFRYQLGGGNIRGLSDESEWDFPHVTLSEILPEGTELKIRQEEELYLISNPSTFAHSQLAPEQYDTNQAALARLPNGESREVRLSLTYIKTRSPELAEWVYTGKVQEWNQEMEEYRENWEENTPYIHDHTPAYDFLQEDVLSWPGLDQLTRFSYQFSDENYPQACYVGRLGSQVFVLSVRGPDLETPLDLLTERLAEQLAAEAV